MVRRENKITTEATNKWIAMLTIAFKPFFFCLRFKFSMIGKVCYIYQTKKKQPTNTCSPAQNVTKLNINCVNLPERIEKYIKLFNFN